MCLEESDGVAAPCTCPSLAVHDLAVHQGHGGCYQPTVTPPADPFAGIPGAHRDESDEWF